MTSSLGRILVVDDEQQVCAVLRDLLVELARVAAAVVMPPEDPARQSDRPGT